MDGKRAKISVDVEMQGGAGYQAPELHKRTSSVIGILIKPGILVVACLIFLLLLVLVLGAAHGNKSTEWLFNVRIVDPEDDDSSPKDMFLGGLLSSRFDESTCLSRYQSALYRKNSGINPSPYLISKLRSYEALHRRCGPGSENYARAIHRLKSNSSSGRSAACNYVVWVPSDGLGNRIMTMVSVFLYALLNDKVLLLHLTDDFGGLFCEPFPGSSWALPSDFPVRDLEDLYTATKKVDGRGELPLPPAYLYVHLTHDQRFSDHRFFCEDYQQLLQSFPWLLLRSNQYFVPALFRSERYQKELDLLFPETASVFHLLGRYLLHPSNSIWSYITRYYDAYLAHANERVGLQIRAFPHAPINQEQMLAQILNCSLQEKLLPNIYSSTEPLDNPGGRWQRRRLKAVLVTSLYSVYFERLRNMYYEHAATTGEMIAVYQPSHEEKQQTERQNHNMKALMEMYLLSFTEELITTGYSTFGYVAQGLGGSRPWILLPGHEKGSPACRRALSIEPCFHSPSGYQCMAETEGSRRHVRQCEDVDLGLKLVD